MHTWYTDFRKALARVHVSTLVIHGDRDRIIPLGAFGALTTRAIKSSRYVTVEGGPHRILWTHADIVNRELVSFLE